ncbi:MAG: NAD(P)/FAD-dependent oxidoreductase [Spirochaetia bacterium]|nr:NAD(P)/FAD-dependent oxidoreductase [Spirochaetia bacterium]
MSGAALSVEKRVVIVGGGFAGINAAKALANKKGIRVTILDKRNHHLFQPLLYQVAMAALSPADIAVPIRSIMSRYDNVDVLLGQAQGVDFAGKNVVTDFGAVPYDYLILACGAGHSYFGHNEWEPFAPGLKSLEEATEIRRRVLTAFELAERERNPEKQRELLTFLVIGAGPTGVELAGALGEISRYTLNNDFRNIDPGRARVILIEGGPRVLPTFSVSTSEKAARALEKLGVTIWTSSIVTDIRADGISIGKESIAARTVLWAAGVQPSELNKSLGVEMDRAGRIAVDTDCSIPGHPEVLVLGDQANFSKGGLDRPLPGLAPVAMQQGRYAAKLILDEVKGRPRRPFRYVDKGIMATVGRSVGVVETGRLKFSGLFGWFTWLLVHIFYLIGFRNRMIVLIQWAWSYVTFSRGARLITSREWQSFKRKDS